MSVFGDASHSSWRTLIAFGLLGLFNNISYVIMLAGANSISAAAVGLVYLAAVGPAIIVKASGPYWFHVVGYPPRMAAAAALMSGSFCLVALSASRPLQLLGVALASFQGGLGEASCLALSARYGSDRGPITLWSSGTGFAGVAGYAWVAALHVWAGLSFRTTLLAGNVLAGAWLATFFLLLRPPPPRPVPLPTSDGEEDDDVAASAGPAPIDPERVPLRPAAAVGLLPRSGSRSALAVEAGGSHAATGRGAGAGPGKPKPGGRTAAALSIQERRPGGAGRGGETGLGAAASLPPSALGPLGRLCLTLGLWPFTVPLFTVYLAEYSMQSGAWTAIGFPVTDAAARHAFYIYANWCYQAGVFVSRSSGMVWQPGMAALWAMPALQAGLLFFFLHDAVVHWWYGWTLLLPCFLTGLLGGAVYVNAFALLSRSVPPIQREFSMAAASVADSLGIACADVAGVLIQGCLFKVNRIPGADYTC